MKNEEILNQEEHDQELPYIKSAFSSIYNGNTKQVSYSDTYNCIYKLCKRGMAEDILNSLNVISTEHFSTILSKIDRNDSEISDFLEMVNQVNQSIERIAEILLYIQSNYINDPKRQYNSIKELLNAAFFDQLCKNKTILERISNQISQARINNKGEIVTSVISTINSLDQKQVFFSTFFVPIYFKKVSEHYKKMFTQNYDKMETKQYLISTKKVLKEEREWLQENFMRSKGKKIIQELMRKIFQSTFDQMKQKIYQQKVDELFKKNTLQFLELLNEKNEEKQINNFNDWYINQIKKKVTAIDRSNNQKFLQTFIYEYLAISDSLAEIKNFNIGYKATFFLEHWINEEKIHLSKRLNIYFEDLIIKNSGNKENINNFTILFKFLKQKDYFEKQFRRACALRMIYDKSKSNSQIQNDMVEQMKNQCGEDWIQNLKKLKASLPQIQIMSTAHTPKFNAIVFQDISWPFQKVKLAPKIPQELLQLARNYKQEYHTNFKGRLMQWYALQGFAILNIRFNEITQQFKMDTVMAIIMLNLQSLKFKSSIQSILKQANLPIQQATEQFQLLQKEGIIKIQGTFKLPEAQKCQVELNYHYKPKKQTKQVDFTQRYLEEEFLQKSGHQELKAERKMMVEAFIVKIMKSNKTLTKPELYEQITPMIENRGFKFSKEFVDNSFEILIDKRYIRDLEDGNFSYLAS